MILISKNFISIVQNIEDYKDIGAEGPYKKKLVDTLPKRQSA